MHLKRTAVCRPLGIFAFEKDGSVPSFFMLFRFVDRRRILIRYFAGGISETERTALGAGTYPFWFSMSF